MTEIQSLSSSARFRINTPDVVQDTIDGEAVIVNLRSGHYYSLEKVGAVIWNSIERELPFSNILQSVCDLYDGEVPKINCDVTKLIEELRVEALIIPVAATESPNLEQTESLENGDRKMKFESPVLVKYTDMQDILLLDPIHDVDDTGWPNIKIDTTE